MSAPVTPASRSKPTLTPESQGDTTPAASATNPREPLTTEDKVCVLGGLIGLVLLTAGGVNEGGQLIQSSCTAKPAAGLEPPESGVPVRGARPRTEKP